MRYFFIFLTLFLYGCANMAPPSGGPKDVSPPVMIDVLYQKENISIIFNENIVVKNQAEFYISPPTETRPEITTKKNILKISSKEELANNSILYFSEMIADYNEGNILTSLIVKSSESTDTNLLTIRGAIKDNISLEPLKKVWAVLYIKGHKNDSILWNQKPDYISKTDEDGFFNFPNLQDTNYVLFALHDKDQNLQYSLKEERVGFHDGIIRPNKDSITILLFSEFDKLDSITPLKNDSLKEFGSLSLDSLPLNSVFELILNDKTILRKFNTDSIFVDSLPPNKYKARIFIDKNKNKSWDAGTLFNRILPEPIEYYPKEINIRSNWEVNINWPK